jgi:hypothetical protein
MLNHLAKRKKLDGDEFVILWLTACLLRKENLLTNMCIRKDLDLQDFIGALISMGDIETRSLMYYQKLEQ